jgi:UDP-N-acetylmuramoylalanine-D-glutamate ligase
LNQKLQLSLATGFVGVVLVIAAPILISTGIDAADAGQQSGNAVVPLLLVGIGTVLVILALARSGPVFEKKNLNAER